MWFELTLERSFDLQKLGRQITQLNSNSIEVMTILIAYYVQSTASSPGRKWVRQSRTEYALMKEALSQVQLDHRGAKWRDSFCFRGPESCWGRWGGHPNRGDHRISRPGDKWSQYFK